MVTVNKKKGKGGQKGGRSAKKPAQTRYVGEGKSEKNKAVRIAREARKAAR